MITVTVFVPLMGGLYDSEYGPHIYMGRLSEDEIRDVGAHLGKGYTKVALCGDEYTGFYVSYANDANAIPRQDEGVCGENYHDVEGSGDLAYSVEYRSLLTFPSLQ